MTANMSTGNPVKHILNFSLPLLAGMLFQRFYNLADTAIVGKLIGSDALAAVGSTGSITFLVLGFCMGICSGFALPAAQHFGAGNYAALRRSVGTSIWLACGISVGMTLLTVLLCRPILVLMRTPADILEQAYEYLLILFLAIPASMLYNMVSGILRSMGDSKMPLVFLILSSVLNIFLDILFIAVFHSGVGGAAWATLISQGISGLVSLLYVVKRVPVLKLSREELKFDSREAVTLCSFGVPMGLQYSVTAVGSAILQSFVNQLGTASVAAISAGGKFSLFLCTPFDALGSAMATYCGQNVGAGRLDRLGPGVFFASLIGSAYSVAVFGAMLFLGKYCSMLFLKPEETEIIAMSAKYLVLQSAFYIPLTLVNVLRFAIQGMGFSMLAISAGFMELVGRALVGILLVPAFGFTAACLGSPVAWILADLFLLPACILCIRSLQTRKADRAQE